jgi:hypothetical protein
MNGGLVFLIGALVGVVGLVWLVVAWLGKRSLLGAGRAVGLGLLLIVWSLVLVATGDHLGVLLVGGVVVGALVVGWLMEARATQPQRRRHLSRQAAAPSGGVVRLPGPGLFALEVKGESHYQKNLEAICGPRTDEGEDRQVIATLIGEDDNRADPNAVRVEIAGYQVGYLSKPDAVGYRQALRVAGYPVLPVASCDARIRGGWQRRNGDTGHYGVWLDVPKE